MAKDGFIQVKVTDYDYLFFSWYVTNQDIYNNETTIRWSLELTATDYGRIASSVYKNWRIVLDGKTITGTASIDIWNNQTKVLASDYVALKHGSDGTRSFSVSFSLDFNITFAGVQIGTKSGSGSFNLNAINQAKELLLSSISVTMGQPVTISISGPLYGETYDVAYSFQGQDYVDIATGLTKDTSSKTWTVPIALAELIPEAMSDIVTLRCTTKNNSGTKIGTKTKSFTANVPNYSPTFDSVTFEEANSKVAAANLGFFVQGLSKLKFKIVASGNYGSTITDIKTTYAGKTYKGAEWTSAALSSAGSNVFQLTITDSRGRTNTGPKTVQATAYIPPTITTFKASRVNTSGVADDEGKRLKMPLSYTYSSLSSKNKVDLQIDYKRSIDSSWSKLWGLTGHTTGGATAQLTSDAISTDYVYDLRLTLTDIVGSKAQAFAKVPAGNVILDIKADGKGIAFFNTSTMDGVEIAGQLPHSPIEIEVGADLASLATPGYYVAPTTTVVNSVKDQLPYGVSGPFTIETRGFGEGNRLQQTLCTGHSAASGNGVWTRQVWASGEAYDHNSWVPVVMGATKILWSGNNLMGSSAQISLNYSTHEVPNGIVLVFSRYDSSGTAQNYAFSTHYVPKMLLLLTTNSSGEYESACVFNMNTTKYEYLASKYLYIGDTYIRGAADNTAKARISASSDGGSNVTATTGGIVYNNGSFALRYVIAV